MKNLVAAFGLFSALIIYSNAQAQVVVGVGGPWMGPPPGWHGGFYAPPRHFVHPAHRGFYPHPHFRRYHPRHYHFRGPVRPPHRRW